MNRILPALIALALPFAAAAQLYKSVDKDGRITYTDQPPPDAKAKALNIAPAPAAAPQKTAVQRVKEEEKGRAAGQEQAKAAEEKSKRAQFDAERCEKARVQLRTLNDGGRFTATDAKGERYFLDENQIEAEKARAQKAVDESCKAS